MKIRPAVLREDFWGDLANTFLLRPVYRETKQEHAAKAAEAKSEERADKAAAEASIAADVSAAETLTAAATAAATAATNPESVRSAMSWATEVGRHAEALPALRSIALEASQGRVLGTSEAILKDWNAYLLAGVGPSGPLRFAMKTSGTGAVSASKEAIGTEADSPESSHTQESVAFYRGLREADSEDSRYVWGLAGTLLTHARALAAEGKSDDAVVSAAEAVSMYRSLQSPGQLTGDYRAAALNTYADVLTAVGREAEAVDLGVEAAQVYEELAEKYPNAYQPGLVAAMISLSKRQSMVGAHEQALANAADAVLRTRKMEAEIPNGHTADLALALANYAERLSESGELGKASEVLNETVELYEKLAERYPLSYTSQLEAVRELLGQWRAMAQGDIETYYEDGSWKNKREGTDRAFGAGYSTKHEAEAAGRDAAQTDKVEHVIKNQDGQIGSKNSYGNDPRNIPG